MFDIGFSELVVIAVVALIVIGPERLPRAARTMGHLFGRLQRYVNDVKADINREMELEELRKLQQQVQGAAREIETSVTGAARDLESGVRSVEDGLRDQPAEAPAAAALPPLAEPAPEPPPAPARTAEAEPPRQARLPGFDPL
ncbi:MAG: Sec-independent protein translocase protein TatB [Betaproteobacteria bacterium]|nr:Sec-independent protein translocase protein TatB [Betaproteobacteria bacterium]MDH5286587.1 Sec-independent protein translocase protein TatB [Betaproteobacteria bacterium]